MTHPGKSSVLLPSGVLRSVVYSSMKETHRKKTPSGLSTLFRKVKVQIGSNI